MKGRYLWCSDSLPAAANPDITMIKACKDELFDVFTRQDLFLADKALCSKELDSWKMFLTAIKKPKFKDLSEEAVAENDKQSEYRGDLTHFWKKFAFLLFLKKTKGLIERKFGELKRRFKIFLTGFRYSAKLFNKALRICFALENCISFRNEEKLKNVTHDVTPFYGDDRSREVSVDDEEESGTEIPRNPDSTSIWYAAFQKLAQTKLLRRKILKQMEEAKPNEAKN